MRILGIDPGLAIVGWGVIDKDRNGIKVVDYGVVTTDKDTPFPIRLKQVYNGVSRLIELHKPDAVAMEELFFRTSD